MFIDKKEKKHTNSYKNTLIALVLAFLMLAFFGFGFFVNKLTQTESEKKINEIAKLMATVGFVYDPTTGEYIELDGDKVAQCIADNFLDQYSDYYTKDEYEQIKKQQKGNYAGFGINLPIDTTAPAEIFSVSGNSPAFWAGLKAGDKIEKIKKSTDQDYTLINNCGDLITFLEGVELNQEVLFKILGVEQPVSVVKSEYIVSYVSYCDGENTLNYTYEKQDNNSLKLKRVITATTLPELSSAQDKQDLAYIKLSAFSGDAFNQFKDAMNYVKENGKKNLVLDLRNNGGGNMQILIDIASCLIDNGGAGGLTVAYAQGKKNTEHFKTSADRFNGQTVEKISVLANENTASASECLIGAMLYHYGEKDKEDSSKYTGEVHTVFGYGRLVIECGEEDAKTYGKGIMQTTFDLESGGALKLTTAKILWPDYKPTKSGSGTCIHNIGIIPKSQDNAVKRAVGEDKPLKRAIQTFLESAIIV